MTKPFRFKEFNILQEINTQKVGTDSMLLGAWTQGVYTSILDIGTGTGILALMMAQQNPHAHIVAIEPDENSLNEAQLNFTNSKYNSQIEAKNSSLQAFSCDRKFDLIISNPPYFENSSLSSNSDKNRVRHTNDLPITTLYQKVINLLKENGSFNLVFPFDMEDLHFTAAKNYGLFPRSILRTKRENNEKKRTLVSFSRFENYKFLEKEIIVKYSDNTYSDEYIQMTRAFYGKSL